MRTCFISSKRTTKWKPMRNIKWDMLLLLGLEFHPPISSTHYPSPQTKTFTPILPKQAGKKDPALQSLPGFCWGTPPSPGGYPPAPEEAIRKLTGDKTNHRGIVGHLSFSNVLLFLSIWLHLVQRYNFQCRSFLVDHTIKVFEKQTALNHGIMKS